MSSLQKLVSQLLARTVKADAQKGLAGQIQQRISQLTIEMLVEQMLSDKLAPEVQAAIYGQLMDIKPWLEKAGNRKRNPNHAAYRLLARQLNWFEQTGQWQSRFKPLAVPPGSPI